MSSSSPPAPRSSPLWLWGVAALPFGVAAGFAQFAMPFLLSNVGVPLDRIAEISALCLWPASYQFLWSPVIDVGPKRKVLLVWLSGLGALCFLFALMMPVTTRLTAFVAFVVAGQALTGLTGACTGGLMATTLPNEVRGRAGGWSNAGNLGGAALGAGVVMWCMGKLPLPAVGALTAAMIFAPSLAVLRIDEPSRPRRSVRALFGGMLTSVWSTVRSRAGITGILICASPVGTAASMNLFSGVGGDYHASDRVVTWVTGFAGGLITAVGSLLGGTISDRIPRRVAYLVSGGLTAVCAFAMSLFPLNQLTYIVGVCAYLFVAGICYASFSALVLEVVGKAGASASTQYSLFTAAGNQAIAYTTVFLGIGAKRWGGPPGMLRADALANVGGILFLAAVMTILHLVASRKVAPSS